VYLTPEVQLASSIAHITILLSVSRRHGTMPYSQELTFSKYVSKGKFTILSLCGTPTLGCPLPDTLIPRQWKPWTASNTIQHTWSMSTTI